MQIQTAWAADDRIRLRQLVAPDLMAEWDRRLDDYRRRGWRNHVEPIGEPKVEYVGLTNRGDEAQDRVVVRIEGKLRDYVIDGAGHHIKRRGRLSETMPVREFWTLGKRRGRWILVSIEQGAEGTHAMEQQIVATPWTDEQSLRDEALVEGAVAEALPADVKPAEVADLQFEGDARAAALDLSLADGRFAPDVLEIAARRAVAAWAEAVDGNDAGLLKLADREAAQHLLHPGDPSERTRLVVRGPKVQPDPDRRARRRGRPADDVDRRGFGGPALHRGSGDGGGPFGQSDESDTVHRALDARVRTAIRDNHGGSSGSTRRSAGSSSSHRARLQRPDSGH